MTAPERRMFWKALEKLQAQIDQLRAEVEKLKEGATK